MTRQSINERLAPEAKDRLASGAAELHEAVERLQSESTQDNAEMAHIIARSVQGELLPFKDCEQSDVLLETQIVADVVRAEELTKKINPQTRYTKHCADQQFRIRHQIHALIAGDPDRWSLITDMSPKELLESEKEETVLSD